MRRAEAVTRSGMGNPEAGSRARDPACKSRGSPAL